MPVRTTASGSGAVAGNGLVENEISSMKIFL
jgi:hypothetical protein